MLLVRLINISCICIVTMLQTALGQNVIKQGEMHIYISTYYYYYKPYIILKESVCFYLHYRFCNTEIKNFKTDLFLHYKNGKLKKKTDTYLEANTFIFINVVLI